VRAFLALLLLGALVSSAVPASSDTEFEPAYNSLVLVNFAVPSRVETNSRLHVAEITAYFGSRLQRVQASLDELVSLKLAGRAPRWASFTLEPAVLDSLVIRWAGFDVQVEEAWTHPPVEGRDTVIRLGQRVEAGEVVVLNLLWQPDAQDRTAADWRPRIDVETLSEPPLGARFYISEEDAGVIAVHERIGGRMVRALPTGGQPRDLAWDPARQRLYAAVAGRDELVSFDPVGRETIRRVPLSFGADPTRVLLSTDRQRIAVLAPGRDLVFLFSASSFQEIAKIRVGQHPVDMAEDPRSGRIYVSCLTAGRVDVIDPYVAEVVTSFEGLESPTQLLVLRSGLLAVGQNPGRRLHLLDPNTGALQSTLNPCGPTDGMVEVPRVDRLFVLSNFCSEISVFRPEAGLELAAIRISELAGLPSLGPRGAEIYVPLPESGQVMLISVDRTSNQRWIDVGPGAWRVVAP